MSKHNGSCHTPLTIDPFRFMELDKPDIHYKLTSELGYPEEEAMREFHSMTAMLTRLKSMRICQSQTDDYLKDAVPNLHSGLKLVTVTILLNATKWDDTYCHAYNTFVYYSNRYLRTDHPRKKITDHQLLMLLDAEKRQAEAPVNGKDKLSLQQIALKHAWEGKPVTQQNKDKIALSLGFKSGNALYNHYCKFANRIDRIADPDATKKIMKNKINLFESVIEMLPEEFKTSPHNELKILKEIFEKKYS